MRGLGRGGIRHIVLGLHREETVIALTALHKLPVAAILHEPSLLKDGDHLSLGGAGQAVRDEDRNAILAFLGKSIKDGGLGKRVKGGGRLIQDQNGRALIEGAGDSKLLPLTARKLRPAFLKEALKRRIVAKGQLPDEGIGLAALARALDLPKSTRTDSPFKDVAIDSVYASYIISLFEAGIVNGDENGNFNGTNKITRAEMATIVWRINNYEG